MAEKKKTDFRVRYTKMVIKKAFLGLLETRPINKITVTDICKDAQINRGTFYAHYTDPYDLLKKIEDELFFEIRNILEKSHVVDTNVDFLVEILKYTEKNKDLCKAVLGPNGDKNFLERILGLAYEESISEYHMNAPNVSSEKLDLLYEFIANGIIGVIQRWLLKDGKETPEQLAEFIGELNRQCISACHFTTKAAN